jgi:predicted ArsR family transcriptional regulator
MTPETTVHRALADPRRAEIVAELRSAGEPLDSSELGRRIGLHANTVRWHLAILTDAGLVRSHSAPRDGPGRPRRVYAATERTQSRDDERPPAADAHRALATALVGIVAGQPGAGEAAERAGRALGREEVAGAGPSADPIARLLAVLDAHGFAPAAPSPTSPASARRSSAAFTAGSSTACWTGSAPGSPSRSSRSSRDPTCASRTWASASLASGRRTPAARRADAGRRRLADVAQRLRGRCTGSPCCR